jgi:hypothetical protein
LNSKAKQFKIIPDEENTDEFVISIYRVYERQEIVMMLHSYALRLHLRVVGLAEHKAAQISDFKDYLRGG